MSRIKALLPNQPVTTTGLRPSRELLQALQIIERESVSAEWGSIGGTLGNQVDLQTELNDLQIGLNGKAATVHTHIATAITDSTGAGRAMLTATDAAAQTGLLNTFGASLKGLSPASGGGTATYLRADGTWVNPLLSAPVTVTADFTLGAGAWVINAKAGSDCVVTLPAASAGRSVTLKTTVGFAIVSAASNVVPLAGGAAGTAIVGNVAGQWATIVYDGTLWQIMAAG